MLFVRSGRGLAGVCRDHVMSVKRDGAMGVNGEQLEMVAVAVELSIAHAYSCAGFCPSKGMCRWTMRCVLIRSLCQEQARDRHMSRQPQLCLCYRLSLVMHSASHSPFLVKHNQRVLSGASPNAHSSCIVLRRHVSSLMPSLSPPIYLAKMVRSRRRRRCR
jgi:hypothetical protein